MNRKTISQMACASLAFAALINTHSINAMECGLAGPVKTSNNTPLNESQWDPNRKASSYELGCTYYEQKDFAKAEFHFTKAAWQGDVNAQYQLGVLILHCPQEANNFNQSDQMTRLSNESPLFEEGCRWLQMAADNGHTRAQCELGKIYNKKEALKYWKLAAEGGYAPAQYQVGIILYRDRDAANLEKAIKLIRLAANQGYDWAQYQLGMHYINYGQGIKKNLRKGINWLTMAANQKDDTSQWFYKDDARLLLCQANESAQSMLTKLLTTTIDSKSNLAS